MEADSVSRRYETRRNAKAKESVPKSRVDWRLTKRQSRWLDDSEEEEEEITSASEEECETSSEGDLNEGESKDESTPNTNENEAVMNACNLSRAKPGEDNSAAGYVDEENIGIRKRKRSCTLVMYDSDESNGSDIVRKVFSKRHCIIDEEDAPAGQELHMSPAEEEKGRKQRRQMKLQELSRRRSLSTSNFSESHEDSEDDEIITDACQALPTPTEISDTSDSDSMKDFIVDDEEREEAEQENESQPQSQNKRNTLLEKHIPRLSRVDHFVHFQRVVRAFLINAVDDNFLASLYEGKRQKRYAQEMLTSLHYLDDRFIQPRLDNLLSRSRWKERYKERVDSYPNVHLVWGNPVKRSCQACELQRYCKVKVILSGKLYRSETLEVDDFMSQDKQVLQVGTVCGSRTQVYHNLKHFKYKLYQKCCDVMKSKEIDDEPVKDSVERAFRELDEDGWIRKQYTDLEDYLDNADYFQDEKTD